jgi:exodeoxyribonuclease VII large subunit
VQQPASIPPSLTNEDVREFQNVYSPGTLLGVYAAALRSPVEGRIVLAKGIFQASAIQKVYGDFFYDSIKSVYENKAVKAKIPALLRNKLENNQVYLFKGFIEKKINFSAIELQFVVDEVLQKEESQVSAEDVKRFQLIQQKIGKGFRDLENLVKDRVYRNETIEIVNIYGNTAIVHKDFEKGIAEASPRFRITEHRCNFSSKAEIIQTLRAFSGSGAQAIALVRGGGDPSSMEIFNDPEVGAAALALEPLLITALGHTVNETLCDKLADKKFALPHDYGNSLKVYVDHAVSEQAQSKSIFIEQVKADLGKTFNEQIKTLQTQLEVRNKEFAEAEKKFKELGEQSQKEKTETIAAKEAAFIAQAKMLEQQIRSGEEALKKQKEQWEENATQKVSLATVEMKMKYQLLEEKYKSLENKSRNFSPLNIILFIIILIILAFVLFRYTA